MDHRHRAIDLQEQRRQRLSNDVRAADDDGAEPGQVGVNRAQQTDASLRRGGNHRREAAPQAPDIDRVKAVHILGGVDRTQNLVWVDVAGQRELHQHTVEAVVAVQLLDFAEEPCFRNATGQTYVECR